MLLRVAPDGSLPPSQRRAMGGGCSRRAVVATLTVSVAATCAFFFTAAPTNTCGTLYPVVPSLAPMCDRESPPVAIPSPPAFPSRPTRVPHSVLLLFRHGARAPVAPLTPTETWPWCAADIYPRALPVAVVGIDGGVPPQLNDVAPATGSDNGSDENEECVAGQLSAVGAASAKALGGALRAAYGTDSTVLDPNTVTVRSTPMRRTVDSAAYVLTGLFHATAATASDGGNISYGGGSGAGDDSLLLDLPPIRVAPAASETLFPNPVACPRLADRLASAAAGVPPAVQSRLSAIAAAATAAAINCDSDCNGGAGCKDNARRRQRPPIPLASDAVAIADVLSSTAAHGAGRPPGVTAADVAVVQAAADGVLRRAFGDEDARRLAVGLLVAELSREVTAAATKAETTTSTLTAAAVEGEGIDPPPSLPALRLYATHDVTLWALAGALGATIQWPPFASTLAIEIYAPRRGNDGGDGGDRGDDGASVRVVYNGTPLVLGCTPRGGTPETPVECLTATLSATALSANATAAACAQQPRRAT